METTTYQVSKLLIAYFVDSIIGGKLILHIILDTEISLYRYCCLR